MALEAHLVSTSAGGLGRAYADHGEEGLGRSGAGAVSGSWTPPGAHARRLAAGWCRESKGEPERTKEANRTEAGTRVHGIHSGQGFNRDSTNRTIVGMLRFNLSMGS